MNIDHFINSELKVTAREHLNIAEDLESKQNHSISDLINNEKTTEKENEKDDQEKKEQKE